MDTTYSRLSDPTYEEVDPKTVLPFIPWPVYARLLRLSLDQQAIARPSQAQAPAPDSLSSTSSSAAAALGVFTGTPIAPDGDLNLLPRPSPLLLRLAVALDEACEQVERAQAAFRSSSIAESGSFDKHSTGDTDNQGRTNLLLDWTTGKQLTVDETERRRDNMEIKLMTAVAVDGQQVLNPTLMHQGSRRTTPLACLLALVHQYAFVPSLIAPNRLVRACVDLLANCGSGLFDLVIRDKGLELRKFNTGWKEGGDMWTVALGGVGRLRTAAVTGGSGSRAEETRQLLAELANQFSIPDPSMLDPPPPPPRGASSITVARHTVANVMVPLRDRGVRFSTLHVVRSLIRSLAGNSSRDEVTDLLADLETMGWTLRGDDGFRVWRSLVTFVLERWYEEPAAQKMARDMEGGFGYGRPGAGDGCSKENERTLRRIGTRARYVVEMPPPHVILSSEGALRAGWWAASGGVVGNSSESEEGLHHSHQGDSGTNGSTPLRKWIRYPVLVARFPLPHILERQGVDHVTDAFRSATGELLEALSEHLVALQLDSASPALVQSVLQEMSTIEMELNSLVVEVTEQDSLGDLAPAAEPPLTVQCGVVPTPFTEHTALRMIAVAAERGVTVRDKVLDVIMEFVQTVHAEDEGGQTAGTLDVVMEEVLSMG
ncbi:hypothetical protein HDU93_002147 [Gonapodya sp. JEL0774]|nr:hypothetical protein HDU93_002147 [Gonapodya sp. JEL0774]